MPERGNFLYLRGGHKMVGDFMSEYPSTFWDAEGRSEHIPDELAPVLVRPGDVYAFHPLLPHNIDKNAVPVDRGVIYAHYGETTFSFA